ncbi:MAG: hypothetical protein H7A41_05240 [Chlamydiales bacterium]|nr:hypothetical protein [Chlamydiales bacterium]
MKKTILTLLLVVGSLYAEYHHTRPQIFYPEYQPPKVGQILGAGEHELRGIGSDGIIEIEDGTQFKAIPSHKNAMKHWDYYDQITFCPNPYPFGGSEFYVINETNKEYFKADIWKSAAVKNPHALRLAEIDRSYQEIILVTQQGMKMRWKIDPEDFDYLRHWKIGDVIVIGKNNNWFSKYFSDYDYILVSYSATEDILYVRGTPKPL